VAKLLDCFSRKSASNTSSLTKHGFPLHTAKSFGLAPDLLFENGLSLFSEVATLGIQVSEKIKKSQKGGQKFDPPDCDLIQAPCIFYRRDIAWEIREVVEKFLEHLAGMCLSCLRADKSCLTDSPRCKRYQPEKEAEDKS
jgi:hypothetical protein